MDRIRLQLIKRIRSPKHQWSMKDNSLLIPNCTKRKPSLNKESLPKAIVGNMVVFMLIAVLSFTGACANIESTEIPSPASKPMQTIHIRFSTWHPADSRECRTIWTPMLEELEKRRE